MKTALIFAAGRGERLRPITDIRPKALCTVHNIPLIEHHVINLARAGYHRVIINHAYLGGQIRQYLGHGQRFGIDIFYSPEPPGALETGGGIVNVLPLLGQEPFITINADIFTQYDFASLHIPTSSLAHLVLVNKPNYSQSGDFGLSNTNQMSNDGKQYTFTGIACYRPELFVNLPFGRYSITPLLRKLVTENQATGELYSGVWFDIGSPERLHQAQMAVTER
ncbi:nucleotidyltransferase family protein [bacterium]|nr:nucleotidyltransferase family protein [bacterium]